MFKQLTSDAGEASPIKITIDEQEVMVGSGQSLAVALLGCNVNPLRWSVVSGQPRSPLCLMGTCFECLVELDGQPNVQACMVQAAPGMKVRLQTGARCIETTP